MTFQEYLKLFENIVSGKFTEPPYNEADILVYTKMNITRMNRWLKTGQILPSVKSALKDFKQPQLWELITEPWCGDAAHIVPFIYLMSEINSHIKLNIQLRDEGSEMDQYLFNGAKAIPRLIVRNKYKEDIFIWGPRPVAAQHLYEQLKNENIGLDDLKIQLQQWYNQNKGTMLQEEIIAGIIH